MIFKRVSDGVRELLDSNVLCITKTIKNKLTREPGKSIDLGLGGHPVQAVKERSAY